MKEHSKKCEANENHINFEPLESECTCDGYHIFDELYNHRIELYIALCRRMYEDANCFIKIWKSKRHSDGSLSFDGKWFVLGINKVEGKQITYHLPISKWKECYFAETLRKAPKFDGHTSDDVLDRLKNL